MATDGHVCYSLGERTIDEFLTAKGIAHEREPAYPIGGFRGDFLIGDTIVEYFGLAGDPAYDEKTRQKRLICAEAGVSLIELYADDLVDEDRLESEAPRDSRWVKPRSRGLGWSGVPDSARPPRSRGQRRGYDPRLYRRLLPPPPPRPQSLPDWLGVVVEGTAG